MDDQHYERTVQILHSFREIHQIHYQMLLRIAQQHGITPQQFLVLRSLAGSPEMNLADLSDELHLGNSTTSGIVDRMVEAELICRERSLMDRRSVTLRLAEKGEHIWNRLVDSKMDWVTPFMQISADDQMALLRIHKQIVHILEKTRKED
ncbi:MarR family winged helix-turn-helix transcriptional regulator [Paenibacillus sp. OV219]|uniref:MarR family winged helix-turn-helix transcriptional regulator n=1 Tax=Paenibacillus sp. OV219 TaxID=1884377 RepID=UPI0008D86CEC|nr:MarR family transcriptional regulator [Paenibacillus sp. OV219]SEM60351.1 DNA-binding transcriptional regulator, MarR family [Paenibacillus sp. OV219]